MFAGGGTPAVLAAKSASSTIPVVFVMSGDAVKLGLAESINRPGANVTGIDIFTTVLDPKRLSLLHDIVPRASTFGYLVNASYPPSVQQISSAEAAVNAMGARALRVLRASTDQDIDAAFETLECKRETKYLLLPVRHISTLNETGLRGWPPGIQFLRFIIFANTLSPVGLSVTASILWMRIGRWRSTPARF